MSIMNKQDFALERKGDMEMRYMIYRLICVVSHCACIMTTCLVSC